MAVQANDLGLPCVLENAPDSDLGMSLVQFDAVGRQVLHLELQRNMFHVYEF